MACLLEVRMRRVEEGLDRQDEKDLKEGRLNRLMSGWIGECLVNKEIDRSRAAENEWRWRWWWWRWSWF